MAEKGEEMDKGTKSEIHSYLRVAAMIAVAIFAGGGYVTQIGENKEGVCRVEEKQEVFIERLHQLELLGKDYQNDAKVTKDAILEIKMGMKDVSAAIQETATSVEVIKEQVDNLERAE